MTNKLNGFDSRVLFAAVPQSVLDNQKRYAAEAAEIAKNRKPIPAGDCPCTRGEFCTIHAA